MSNKLDVPQLKSTFMTSTAFALNCSPVSGATLCASCREAQVAWSYWHWGAGGTRFGGNGVPADVVEFRERCYRKLQRMK